MTRVDRYLYATGHTVSRKKAQDLIDQSLVKIDGEIIDKSSRLIDESVPHAVELIENCPFVSRGGLKLQQALDAFSVDPSGMACVDIGASTGGFTDCLLSRGAESVVCVDVGTSQLHPKIAGDKRVTVMEKTNARYLTSEAIGGVKDLLVSDVSFISQTLLLPVYATLVRQGGTIVSLVKPQFEVGRSGLSKTGVVVSASYRYLALKRVVTCALNAGLDPVGLIASPITGGDGNHEYLLLLRNRSVVTCSIPDKLLQNLSLQ